MIVIVKRILNYGCNNVQRLLDFRSYKQLHHVLYKNDQWNRRSFIAFQRFPQLDECFLAHRTCTDVAHKKEVDLNNKNPFEHVQMHLFLQNSEKYANTIVPKIKTTYIVTEEQIDDIVNMDWSEKSTKDFLNDMKKLAHFHLNNKSLPNETYERILQYLILKLPMFNDKELRLLMPYLIVMSKHWQYTSAYDRFVKELSNRCVALFFTSNVNELLLTIDSFYQMQLWKAQYMWRAIRKIGSKLHRIDGSSMVQFLFYLSVCQAPDIQMFDVECQLLEKLSELSPDEVGIACRGFFKSKRKFQNPILITKILEKVTNNVSVMKDSSLGSVMKQIRYSSGTSHQKLFSAFLKKFKSSERCENSSLLLLVHVGHTMAALRICDLSVATYLLNRLEKEFSNARLKDIERILYAVCSITPTSELKDSCERILTLLLSTYKTIREHEIRLYPKCLIHILTYLSYKNIYSEELLAYVFDPNNLRNAYNDNIMHLTSDFLILHCTMQIELPTYTGPLLNDKLYTILVTKYCSKEKFDEGNIYLKFRAELLSLCRDLFGSTVRIDYVLPHYYTGDIIIGLDENNRYIPVHPTLTLLQKGKIKRVPNIRWKILVAMNYHSYIMNSDHYITSTHVRLRQLQRIGYIPVPVHRFIWNTFQTTEEKYVYLKKLLFKDKPMDFEKDIKYC